MEKEIILSKSERFVFEHSNETNSWRIIESQILISGFTVDLMIYLDNFKNSSFNWEDVESFLRYLILNKSKITKSFTSAQRVLRTLVKEVWTRGFTQEELNNFDFHPLAIEFQGVQKGILPGYEFEISFGPIDLSDNHRDLGVKSWIAQFINDQLVGVKRDV